MELKQWYTIIVLVTLFKLIFTFTCNDQSMCSVESYKNTSLTEQIIEIGKKYCNKSFTILLYAGNYTTNNGTMNFINFTNVTMKRQPDNTMPVNIMCPNFTNDIYNGIGFEYSTDIEISGLNFMKCGSITSGLYFRYTKNIIIANSLFHHNSDNGIQIVYGNNITITDCNFYSNIGMQPDNISDLITSGTYTKGAGLGLVFEDQSNISVTISNCNFINNIALKSRDYDLSAEERPYGLIPFGNGGGIYLNLYSVKHLYASVYNCSFKNNACIHQGGAVVMIALNSSDNILNISQCLFTLNKVLSYFLLPQNNITEESIDDFIDEINMNFSSDFNISSVYDVYGELKSSGGFGGAIGVSLFGSVEHNMLIVSNSQFKCNGAFSAGAIGFVVRDLLANVENGMDSNQVFIHNCTFKSNSAFFGSAIQIASYSRVDLASLPIEIQDCTFKENFNFKNQLPNEFERHFGVSGAVVGTRFPVSFHGTNVFESNLGGGINLNYARVTVCGHLIFYNHQHAGFGGAVRLGELTLYGLTLKTNNGVQFFIPHNTLLGRLHCVFILPIMDYCDIVWSPSSVQYFKRFERVHFERRRFHTAIMVYRTLHYLSPIYLQDTFNYTTTVTSHVGRNSYRLFVPRVQTNYGKNSLYYIGTQVWNSLHASLYTAATLGQFKYLYKSTF